MRESLLLVSIGSARLSLDKGMCSRVDYIEWLLSIETPSIAAAAYLELIFALANFNLTLSYP